MRKFLSGATDKRPTLEVPPTKPVRSLSNTSDRADPRQRSSANYRKSRATGTHIQVSNPDVHYEPVIIHDHDKVALLERNIQHRPSLQQLLGASIMHLDPCVISSVSDGQTVTISDWSISVHCVMQSSLGKELLHIFASTLHSSIFLDFYENILIFERAPLVEIPSRARKIVEKFVQKVEPSRRCLSVEDEHDLFAKLLDVFMGRTTLLDARSMFSRVKEKLVDGFNAQYLKAFCGGYLYQAAESLLSHKVTAYTPKEAIAEQDHNSESDNVQRDDQASNPSESAPTQGASMDSNKESADDNANGTLSNLDALVDSQQDTSKELLENEGLNVIADAEKIESHVATSSLEPESTATSMDNLAVEIQVSHVESPSPQTPQPTISFETPSPANSVQEAADSLSQKLQIADDAQMESVESSKPDHSIQKEDEVVVNAQSEGGLQTSNVVGQFDTNQGDGVSNHVNAEENKQVASSETTIIPNENPADDSDSSSDDLSALCDHDRDEWSASLDTLLQSVKGCLFFTSFLKSENAEGNIRFLHEVDHFYEISKETEKISTAAKIIEAFFLPSSSNQTCMTQPTRNAVLRTYEELRSADLQVHGNIFDGARKEVYEFLSGDAYNRFLKSTLVSTPQVDNHSEATTEENKLEQDEFANMEESFNASRLRRSGTVFAPSSNSITEHKTTQKRRTSVVHGLPSGIMPMSREEITKLKEMQREERHRKEKIQEAERKKAEDAEKDKIRTRPPSISGPARLTDSGKRQAFTFKNAISVKVPQNESTTETAQQTQETKPPAAPSTPLSALVSFWSTMEKTKASTPATTEQTQTTARKRVETMGARSPLMWTGKQTRSPPTPSNSHPTESTEPKN
eukprot:TRINITY_DN7361_c0_g2_i11.p1 TRINITY_DN7361_c0_g2~~TRINITY_DN7361_c0_g2_i11.p1  ORF type:complete len:861 (+),score=193.51 TRINITY_DN7361_c0_g2_i11:43-2625(+)